MTEAATGGRGAPRSGRSGVSETAAGIDQIGNERCGAGQVATRTPRALLKVPMWYGTRDSTLQCSKVPSSRGAQDASAVSVIDIDHGVVPFGQLHDVLHRCDVSVHTRRVRL